MDGIGELGEMALERDFLTLAPQTVTLEPLSTHDLYGAPSFGTSVSYSALVMQESKLVRAADGREVVSGTQVYIPSSSAAVGEQDRLTLPDGTQPEIIRVSVYSDDDGQHNITVFCG